jgi:hypothetical protein
VVPGERPRRVGEMRLHTDWTRLKVATAGLGLVAATLISSSVSASNPSPSFIPPTADWLSTVNYYRAMAGVGQVVEDSTMSAGA